MTSANPPSPYFNGITYNSQFFKTTTSSSSGGLTQSQANALYMKKPLDPVADGSTTLYTTITTNIAKTVTLTQLGETYNYIRSTDTASAANGGDVPLVTLTITNAGVYIVSYQVVVGAAFGAGFLSAAQSLLNISSPTANTNIAKVCNNYPSAYLNAFLNNPILNTSWTGLINAGATVNLVANIYYNAGPFTAYIYGSSSIGNTYLTITRIA